MPNCDRLLKCVEDKIDVSQDFTDSLRRKLFNGEISQECFGSLYLKVFFINLAEIIVVICFFG